MFGQHEAVAAALRALWARTVSMASTDAVGSAASRGISFADGFFSCLIGNSGWSDGAGCGDGDSALTAAGGDDEPCAEACTPKHINQRDGRMRWLAGWRRDAARICATSLHARGGVGGAALQGMPRIRDASSAIPRATEAERRLPPGA
jgi:hypothetical protein